MEVDDASLKDVAVREDSHCVFNVNSYQMVFVANSESFLYKRHAFTRAKQVRTALLHNHAALFVFNERFVVDVQCHKAVTLQMRKRFVAWREAWSSTHVKPEAEAATASWMAGSGDHLELKTNCNTVRVVNHVENRAPFGTLIKYRVDYDK